MLGGYCLEVDELILDDWEKANKGDLTRLRKKKGKGNAKDDLRAWDIILDNYIKVIGISKYYKEYLMLLYQKGKADLKYLNSEIMVEGMPMRNRKLLIPIMALEAKLTKFRMQGGTKLTISQVLIKIHRIHGGEFLSKKKLTVTDYQDLLNEYTKDGTN